MAALPSEFLLYQSESGETRIEVRLFEETVWLTQAQMAELFDKDVRTVSMSTSATSMKRASATKRQVSGNSGWFEYTNRATLAATSDGNAGVVWKSTYNTIVKSTYPATREAVYNATCRVTR